MAGIILVIMGLAGFGTIIKFIPYSVVVGFTSGIAVVIFSSQMKDFLGLRIENVPAEFIDKWRVFLWSLGGANPYALALALLTVLIIAAWPRPLRRVPGSFFAIILTSILAAALNLPVETIGSRFGGLPQALPLPRIPRVDIQPERGP